MRPFLTMLATAIHCGIKDYLVTMSPKLYLMTTLPRLIAQVLFFSLIGQFLGGKDLLLYALVGNTVVSVAGQALTIASQNLSGALRGGTLSLLVTTPTSPHWTILTWGSGQLLLAFVNGLIGLYILAPLFGLRLGPYALWAIPVLAITTLSVYGLGLVVAAISLKTQGAFLIGSSFLIVLYALVGVNFPITTLPGWLQRIGWSLPLSHGILAIRSLMTGQHLEHTAQWIGAEIFVGALYLSLGLLLFQMQIAVGRRRGTLEFTA